MPQENNAPRRPLWTFANANNVENDAEQNNEQNDENLEARNNPVEFANMVFPENPWRDRDRNIANQVRNVENPVENYRERMREQMERRQLQMAIENQKPKSTTSSRKTKRRVGIAYPAFLTSFKRFYPDIKLIESAEEVRNFDLIIFSGGEDINPRLYGEVPTHSYNINERRDNIEQSIFDACSRKRVLGVCRGHQLINAIYGGRLCQDYGIEKGVFHNNVHTLDFREGVEHGYSTVYKFFNGKTVISAHHQSVENTPGPLLWTSTHKGIIESTETEKVITVQFHPEFDPDKDYVRKFFKFLQEEW